MSLLCLSDNEGRDERVEPVVEEVSDNQMGYEADGSGTDEEPSTTLSTPAHTAGGASPRAEPESDQATGSTPSARWYGEEEDSSSEQEWSMTLPTPLSDWTNSFTQSDSHSSGSDSSWETEEEEVVIGGGQELEEENWDDELGDGETVARAVLPMETFPTGPLSTNAYDAHIRLDQNGTAHDPVSPATDGPISRE